MSMNYLPLSSPTTEDRLTPIPFPLPSPTEDRLPTPLGEPVQQRVYDFAQWIMTVISCANGAKESIFELSNLLTPRVPQCRCSSILQELVERVQNVVRNNKFDPGLKLAADRAKQELSKEFSCVGFPESRPDSVSPSVFSFSPSGTGSYLSK